MEENKGKNFFVILLITILLGAGLGYILNSYFYEANSAWTYIVVWAILFFGYFRVYTLLINPKRLLIFPYAVAGTFSKLILIYPLVWAVAILIFVLFGPIEYFHKDFFKWATEWDDLRYIFYGA